MSRVAAPLLSVALVAFAQVALVPAALAGAHDALIAKHAALNGVPEQLIRRVIRIESRGNAGAVHAGNYGLMQIRLGTARGVGFGGDADGLRDPETNLAWGIKYLAGAWRAARGDHDLAMRYYASGYYYVAKQQRRERLQQAAAAPASAPPKPLPGAKPQENAKQAAGVEAKPAAPAARPKAAARKPREAKNDVEAEVPRPPAAISGGANTAKPR